METTKTYDNFPVWVVIISNLSSFIIYFSGVILTLHLGLIAAVIYLAFILALEYRLVSRHCVNCYYWGKICGFGKGKISSLFFKKGEASKFCDKEMTWKDMIPDLLVSLVPLIIGVVLMIIKFELILLIAVILIIGLSTSGNAFIRGKLTCRYCRQREIACPAQKLFSKE